VRSGEKEVDGQYAMCRCRHHPEGLKVESRIGMMFLKGRVGQYWS
jgi:hypothetical protein